MDAEDEFSWPTANFRQSVAQKIEEALANVGMPTSKTGVEIENNLFRTSENKEEYMWIVYELVLHMVEMRYGKNRGSGEPEDTEDDEEEEESEEEGEDWTMDDECTDDQTKK